MSGSKYRPDMSWTDVELMIEEQFHTWGRDVLFHVKPDPSLRERAYLTVISYSRYGTATGSSEYFTRHPFDPRNPSRVYSQLIRALFDHLASYEADPWAWDARRRAQARGEE